MPRLAVPLLLLGALLVPALAVAESADQREARRLWLITETVLDQHVEPPARQQLLLAALRAAYRQSGRPAPAALARQVSQVTTEPQLAELLQQASHGARRPTEAVWPNQLVHAMFAQVPGRTAFLTGEDLQRRGIHTGNRYIGTGIQIRVHPDGYTQIMIPIAGGPARRAGARPGDLIVAVDGVDMKGHSIQDVVKRVGGQEGKPVTLTVRQPGTSKPRALHMIRGVVPFENVVGYRRTGEESWQYRIDPAVPITYLRLDDLTSSTAHQLRQLEGQLSGETRAVILDLRAVMGTELEYAEQVADALIDGGRLWSVRDARGHIHEHRADRDCLFRGLPMIVLIDNHTTGKAALIAAALRARRNAIVVGQSAVVDLWVRELVKVPNDLGNLELPTGMVEQVPAPPKTVPTMILQMAPGYSRVDPDENVPMSSEEQASLSRWNQQQHSPEPPADALRQPPKDPQLARALHLLKDKLKHTQQQAGKP